MAAPYRTAVANSQNAEMSGKRRPTYGSPETREEWDRYFEAVYGPHWRAQRGDPGYEESRNWHADPAVLKFYEDAFRADGKVAPHVRGRGGKRKTKKRKNKKRKTKKRVSKKYA